MWAVGYVSSNTEMKVLRKIRELGLDAFVPLGRKITKPANKKKPVLTSYKFFPGYVFVRIPEQAYISPLMKLRINFLTYRDKKQHPHIISLPDNVIRDLMNRDEMSDLFSDLEKDDLRKTFNKNDLVCWKEERGYALGFVEKSTNGSKYAHIQITKSNRKKISVDLLSLLSG